MSQQFASDNNAGICPAALEAMLRANAAGHAPAYGDDAWTAEAKDRAGRLFETEADVFLVFNGTAANGLALAQICRPYHAVIAHRHSHIESDEAGAAGFFSGGAKLLTADTPLAKLTPEAVEMLAAPGRGVHHVKPRALSLTQATELGTVYSVEEIEALTAVARRQGLKVHMDGARLANAIATLGRPPADVTWRAGVDVLCFGGVKNGLAVGELIMFFDRALAEEFGWRMKQAGQLNAKMRLVAAAWIGLMENGVWLDNAHHANAMARRLAGRLAELDGIRLMHPVEANAVFVEIPADLQAKLRRQGWRFHTFLGDRGCRLMCAWDTSPETVDRFADDLAAAIN